MRERTMSSVVLGGLLSFGFLVVGGPSALAGSSNCCTAWGGAGCDDPTCAALICSFDPSCCTNNWDLICADGAEFVCGLCDGDCCSASGGEGCNDPTCTAAVCSADLFCCEVSWDAACAILASTSCPELCGDGGGDECLGDFDGNAAVDGADLAVLLGGWGSSIGDLDGDALTDGADLALLLGAWGACPSAPVCGVGDDCCTAHATPGCSDFACCEVICFNDPHCCDSSWDALCVAQVPKACGVRCN